MTMIVYKAANEKIEKWIKKLLNIQNYKLIPLYFFPSMIFSYFSYYALDLSEESFRLMFPATYVQRGLLKLLYWTVNIMNFFQVSLQLENSKSILSYNGTSIYGALLLCCNHFMHIFHILWFLYLLCCIYRRSCLQLGYDAKQNEIWCWKNWKNISWSQYWNQKWIIRKHSISFRFKTVQCQLFFIKIL